MKNKILACVLAGIAAISILGGTTAYAAEVPEPEEIHKGDGTTDSSEEGESDRPQVETTTLDFGTFENIYTADSVFVSLSGKKVLTDTSKSGKTLAGDDFSFQLVDSTGKVVETVKNKADGTIKFSDLTYTTPGTYTYTIKEVAGSDKHITYDKSIKTVTVTVTGENGVLSVNAEAGVQTQAETSEKPVEGN